MLARSVVSYAGFMEHRGVEANQPFNFVPRIGDNVG